VGLRTRIFEGIEVCLKRVEWLQPEIEQREDDDDQRSIDSQRPYKEGYY